MTFAVTDIAVPGNSAIPVELRRWIPSQDIDIGGPTGWRQWNLPLIKGNYLDVKAGHTDTGWDWGYNGSSPPQQPAPSLVCERLTRNVQGDIDPVPSPNGQYVAFRRMTIASPELGELHYLHLDSPRESNVLLGAGEFHGGASWSPDSHWIGYTAFERRNPESEFVVNSVYKVNVATNEKVRLVDGRTIPQIGEHTSWTASNELYFATPDAFYVIDPDGGSPRKKLGIHAELGRAPLHLVADARGKSIAFTVAPSDSGDPVLRRRSGIWFADLEAGQIVQITHESSDTFPVWLEAGTILFLRESSDAGYSLHSISLSTGKVRSVRSERIVASLGKLPDRDVLFAATAERWDVSGNDFNFFRGFSIAKCTMTSHSNRH